MRESIIRLIKYQVRLIKIFGSLKLDTDLSKSVQIANIENVHVLSCINIFRVPKKLFEPENSNISQETLQVLIQ